MKLSITRPEKICWIAIPPILLTGLMTLNETLDIQVHDTYFVFSNFHLGILSGLILGILGLGYWFVNKIKGDLTESLTWVHLIFTIGGILLALMLTTLPDSGAEVKGDYETFRFINFGISGAMLAIILSQPLYLINLITGFFRRKK